MIQERAGDFKRQGTQWVWSRACGHHTEVDVADGRVDFQRQELQLAWCLPEVLEVGARMQGC